ncbi:uncharacterized protein LOC125297660 [Alosa alosa]|uniref:uncharacterized protein LOC125297660 n=1 Tax=Alosa alosa TaxID=278164 RepID=UPI0020152BA3|nr:uncharacterized protein LOC125297660 [Alosa alosa]
MTPEGRSGIPPNLLGSHQALLIDYSKQQYQPGHLYPDCCGCDITSSESSFTLTNAAPQDEEDATDWHGQVEKVTANYIDNRCQPDSTHVATGMVPGNAWVVRGGARRVNVPAHFWSAFCCTDRVKGCSALGSTRKVTATKTGMRKLKDDWKMIAERMSVAELNAELARLHSVPSFKVFGDCSDRSWIPLIGQDKLPAVIEFEVHVDVGSQPQLISNEPITVKAAGMWLATVKAAGMWLAT